MNLSFTIDNLPPFLVFLVLAALIGWFTDLIAGGRVPLGFFGSILFGLLGAWVATAIVRPRVPVTLPKEPTLDGVMLITAAIGAFVFSMLWCVLSSRVARNFR
ncbi:MAG: GlsB/YeaQ/YmgE family stress response membrane protein [Chloroflexota bacterium]